MSNATSSGFGLRGRSYPRYPGEASHRRDGIASRLRLALNNILGKKAHVRDQPVLEAVDRHGMD
jgi:hypothetical protein